jgi:transcriptional regulator with XRE-family HTH domain
MSTENNSPAPDREIIDRAERLKEALKLAGGAAAVARKIGMPMPTLNNYIAGRDMKASAVVALADGCGVSVEWLATGRGDISRGHQSGNSEMASYFGDYLYKPANFMGLCLLLSLCQEYHHRGGEVPTLADVFGWIGPLYPKAHKLQDKKIEFNAEGTIL